MREYRVYFLDDDGRIADREEFRAETDWVASIKAKNMLCKRAEHRGIEVWAESRVIHREVRRSIFAEPKTVRA